MSQYIVECKFQTSLSPLSYETGILAIDDERELREVVSVINECLDMDDLGYGYSKYKADVMIDYIHKVMKRFSIKGVPITTPKVYIERGRRYSLLQSVETSDRAKFETPSSTRG
jgi:hypothetical protein